MTETLSHLIGGKHSGAAKLDSLNPSNTDDIVARYPDGGAEDVNDAVAAARAAFPGWSNGSPEVRADLLDKVGTMILERRESAGHACWRGKKARPCRKRSGKPRAPAASSNISRARRCAGTATIWNSTRPGVEVETYREAVGVYGLIAPWNFPIAIPAWKTAPALAFGNTVVLKSASQTPATAAALAAIIEEAGAPAGVFNLVLGGPKVGDALVKHPDVNAISFTGSQGVGAKVAQAAVARQARVQLEMGGKNPLLVLDDAEFDRAVQIALDGGYFSTGQRCTASSRVIRHGRHPRPLHRGAGGSRQGAQGGRCAGFRVSGRSGGERRPAGEKSLLCEDRSGRGRPADGRRRAG